MVKKLINVVCGAKNLYENMKTVFAPNGTYIPGKKFKLEKKILEELKVTECFALRGALHSDDSEGIIDLNNLYRNWRKVLVVI